MPIYDWEKVVNETNQLNGNKNNNKINLLDGAKDFSNYLYANNKVFQGFLWIFFVFGFLLAGLLIFGINPLKFI